MEKDLSSYYARFNNNCMETYSEFKDNPPAMLVYAQNFVEIATGVAAKAALPIMPKEKKNEQKR